MERRALGRGLSALIPEKQVDISEERPAGIRTVRLEEIAPNRFQPRENFDEQKLEELISSIREKGVLQPMIVRSREGGYELITGERRLRAARVLGFKEVPVIVKEVNDADMLELSLIENIQRQELNAIEEARAYQRLIDEFSFTQDEVARAVGKDKATVSNMIRLLGLPRRIHEMVIADELSMGHARALLGLVGEHARMRVANRIVRKGLSVREAEQLVARKRAPKERGAAKEGGNPEIRAFEEEFQRRLGTRVRIRHGKKRGRIEIEYYSEQDLKRILDTIA